MNQYKEYSLEDFVLDAQFQNWVRYKRENDITFWENYLAENPSQASEIFRAQSLLESVYRHYESHVDDTEIDFEIQELLNKVRATKVISVSEEQEIQSPVRKIFGISRYSFIRAAASVVFIMGIAWLYRHDKMNQSSYNRLTSGKSMHEEANESNTAKLITLSDGSKITLLPHSKISFPENFLPERREVYLSGKAAFQVSKDPKRPFLVYANDLVTKVLGTTFTINASDNAQRTTVEVKEGKVSVFRQADFADAKNHKMLQSKGMVITANQKVVYERETTSMLKTIIDSPQVVTREKTMTFDFVDTPASEVLADLKEAYQVDIIFDKDILRDCPVTASLSKQTLFEKLDIICEVIEARYEMIDGQIVVYSKGCKN